MSKETHNITSWFLNKFRPTLRQVEPPALDDLQFTMEANGFTVAPDGAWKPDNLLRDKFDKEFNTFRYGIFGSKSRIFDNSRSGEEIARMLNKPTILDVIGNYRQFDPGGAKRIALVLGNTARLPFHEDHDSAFSAIEKQVEHISRLASLGEGRSGEAITSSLALYLMSDFISESDSHFEKNTTDMAAAIVEDNTNLQEVADLGLSQAKKLWRFIKKAQSRDLEESVEVSLPDITDYRKVFANFPTVGVEYHLREDEETFDNFWQRVALLNMSQYQREALIPFSREDQGLIEIRMNPSIYPVATATWKLMRWVLPELNQHYFTITLNRKDQNLSQRTDQSIISSLQSLGSLCYAAHRRRVLVAEDQERYPQFGSAYMGRTVSEKGGQFGLTGGTGRWMRFGEGQLNLYTGFGDMYPDLAYYLSMALADPELLDHNVPKGQAITPKEAVERSAGDIRSRFEGINHYIMNSPELRQATEDGQKIIDLLSP